MRAMRGSLLTACLLLAGLALSACGGDDKKTSKACRPGTDAALEQAAREHTDKIIVGLKEVGDADKITVDACKTADDEATATVTAEGLRDDSIRDQRHTMTLKKRNGKWAIVQDHDTVRCRKGRGHQDFSSLQCT
jgi:hypothetical protein